MWSSNCSIIKIGWGFAPDPSGGVYSAPPHPRSWISIYRPFGPLLSGLYCRPFAPPLWVIPLLGFQMLACLWLPHVYGLYIHYHCLLQDKYAFGVFKVVSWNMLGLHTQGCWSSKCVWKSDLLRVVFLPAVNTSPLTHCVTNSPLGPVWMLFSLLVTHLTAAISNLFVAAANQPSFVSGGQGWHC